MDNIKYLMVNFEDGILTDIIKRIINRDNVRDIDHVYLVNDSDLDMYDDIGCLIIDCNGKELPVEYQTVTMLNEKLMIIELLNNGKSVGVYMDDVSEKLISQIINIRESQ